MKTILSILITALFCPMPAFAIDCRKAVTDYDKLVCGNPELLKHDRQLNKLYTQLRSKLWLTERNVLRESIRELNRKREDKSKFQPGDTSPNIRLITDVAELFEADIKMLQHRISLRHDGLPSDQQVREKICIGKDPCNFVYHNFAGNDTLGHRIYLVREIGPSLAGQSGDSCEQVAYWRLTYDGKKIRRSDRIMEDTWIGENPWEPSRPCASANDPGKITITDNILTYVFSYVNGSTTETWQLQPELQRLRGVEHAYDKFLLTTSESITDYALDLTRETNQYPIYSAKPENPPDVRGRTYYAIPALPLGSGAIEEWLYREPEKYLRVRADGATAKWTAGFVIGAAYTGLTGTVPMFRVASLDSRYLWIEVSNIPSLPDKSEWRNAPHLQIWHWPNPPTGCLLPTWDKDAMAKIAALESSGDGTQRRNYPCQISEPGALYEWGIRIRDGKVFPGFGQTAAEGIRINTKRVDEAFIRFLVELKEPGPTTVALSIPAGNGQHLTIATSQLLPGDPTSLGR